ncbi:MAG: hypothetical protein EBT86_07180 [Actinobacteria bacterium]|nr:hypothetical protein [Actinomycetota bacterium]
MSDNQPNSTSQSQSLSDKPSETWNKFLLRIKYSFYSAVLFFLLANPETYKVLNRVFGKYFSYIDSAGVPTALGFFAQSGLFFLVILGLMMMPNL